ncbi:hypothetical protein [Streptomyces sp. DH37]|uniref:hypothetical protein n=1 Tax=Streptomyces sp. DH37 TaxID=3040122 RepID=UPI002441D45F|nr:hypothetical protein [Streptomyces sp. DH37]MDG9705523.1 hypothetical protein [Streptomyces sp. DH37]
MADLAMPVCIDAPPPARRTVAVGVIRRSGGRTTTLTATEAGASGSIRPAVTR